MKLQNNPAVTLVGAIGILLTILLVFFAARPESPRVATKENVWKHIQRAATTYGLDADFVYAIAMAESTLQPDASTGYARGIMQISQGAWEMVSKEPYRHAWNWEKNIDAGCAYLAYNKKFLEEQGHFSYPLLAACYRFGRQTVRRADFRMEALPTARNRIYQELFAGNLRPIAPPR